MATQNKELYLAACLLSRPEYVPALFPPTSAESGDLRAIENRVARAAITVLLTQGPAFANPSAMSAALADLPEELDGDEVVALFQLTPDADEVVLSELVSIRDELYRAADRRRLGRQLVLSGTELRNATADEKPVAEAMEALRAYQRGGFGKTATAGAVLERMASGKVTIRWKMGAPLFDELNQGIGPDGEFGSGVLGQGEVVIFAAMYGVGKSRLLLNVISALTDQPGSSVSLLVGEDSEAAYATKLMGIRFGLEHWRIQRYLVRRQAFLDQYGREEALRVEEAQQWYADLGDRLRIYDGEAKTNIFKFSSAVTLLEEDKALYGTTHTAIDYINIWKGDTPQLEAYAQELRAFAGRTNTGLLLLSQVSNETQKFGAAPGQVPTKGSGEWGQTAHTAYFLEKDPVVGQKELRVTQVKGRDSGMSVAYAEIDEPTGKIKEWRGTPHFYPMPVDPDAPKGKKGPRK